MDGPDLRVLKVALLLPQDGGRPGVAHGAAQLAAWLAGDARMALVAVAHAAAPPARDLTARLLRAEAGLRRVAPVQPLDPRHVTPEHGAPDVLIDLTGNDAPRDPAPPFGVWRLSAHERHAGFAEAAAGAPVSHVTLTAHRDGGCQTIGSASYGTKPLAGVNAAFIAEKSVQLVCRALAELHLTGALPALPTGPGRPAAPTGGLLRYGAGLLPRIGRRAAGCLGKWAGLGGPAFALLLCKGRPLDFDPAQGVALLPPRGHFWADPFLFEQGRALYLFFEDFDARLGRGLLKVARVEGDDLDVLGAPITAPYHLSYPFVFKAEGEIWMIPETVAARRIEVWRAVEFPLRWERAATALEGRAAADSVVAQHGGAWWLLTNLSQDSFGDHCSELHVFRAEGPDLRGLKPHPLNPVVIDSTTARGGGRVWSEDGRLFRASQDNSHGTYGWGLNVMEITRLDMEGYAERRVRHVTPGTAPRLRACHHVDFAAGRVVMDARLTRARRRR